MLAAFQIFGVLSSTNTGRPYVRLGSSGLGRRGFSDGE